MADSLPEPQPEPEEPEPQPLVTAVLVGAGDRGGIYAQYAIEQPTLMKLVAVCEPNEVRRSKICTIHSIPPENAFETWEAMLEAEPPRGPRIADCALICTQDQLHRAPAVAFARRRYDILLEKPMADNEEDCVAIAEAAESAGIILAVAHVLRYTPYFRKLHELIASGSIGEVMNIQHLEPVGWFHFAHSFVRGNWRREDESSFFLMVGAAIIRMPVGARAADDDVVLIWMCAGEGLPRRRPADLDGP